MASSLILPLVLWSCPPSADVTCTYATSSYIVTGHSDGTLLIWSIQHSEHEEIQLLPKLLLVGHSAPVTCVVVTNEEDEEERAIVSGAADGEIARWSLLDGRCLAVNSRGYSGKPLKLLIYQAFSKEYLLISGLMSEICILDLISLETIRIWGGHKNWATVSPFQGQETTSSTLLTATFSGLLSTWSIDEQLVISRINEGILMLEDCRQVKELLMNEWRKDMVLTLSPECIHVVQLAADRVSSFLKVKCIPESGRWVGAKFLSAEQIIVWSEFGDIYAYSLKDATSSEGNSAKEPVASRVFSGDISRIITYTAIERLSSSSDRWVVASFSGENVALFTISLPVEHDNKYAPQAKLLSDLWPLEKHAGPKITSTAMISEKFMAYGYDTGDILILPISQIFTNFEAQGPNFSRMAFSSSVRRLRGHTRQVNCLLWCGDKDSSANAIATELGKRNRDDENSCGEDQYLVSGGDGLRVWSLGSETHTTLWHHAYPIVKLLQAPTEGLSPRLKGCVVAIAEDHSVSIISLEEMSCLYLFPGHPYPPRTIQWRIDEDFLALMYEDGTAFIWELQTAHLNRVVNGATAADILNDTKWPMSTLGQRDEKASLRQSIASLMPISQPTVLLVNIKNLISAIYQGSMHPGSPSEESEISVSAPEANHSQETEAPSLPTTSSSVVPPSATGLMVAASKQTQTTESQTLRALVSALVTWNTDEEVDKICSEKLSITRPSRTVTVGLRGANGYFSVLSPCYADGKACWCVSGNMSAMRLLSIIAVTRSLLSVQGLEPYSSQLMTHYGSLLPDSVGPAYRLPALAQLAKYWQDPQSDIQEAARSLFIASLSKMTEEEQNKTVRSWEEYLPAVSSASPQYMLRSTIILGIMGADYPSVLPKDTRKAVALSLMILLSDDSKSSWRIPAIELLSRGFATWEPHLKAGEVIRTLFSLANDQHPDSLSPTEAAVVRVARLAILQIAQITPELFLPTLIHDLLVTKNPAEQVLNMRLLSMLVRKKPVVLFGSVLQIAESVVRSLDPNTPGMREAVLQPTSVVLHDMVRTYPFVDFHKGSQRLAVGTLEGAVVVFDLRSATRWAILEDHARAVAAVSFSADGKIVVSCSVEEGRVCIWHLSVGLLGVFASATGAASLLSSVQKPAQNFTFNFGETQENTCKYVPTLLQSVRFEWAGEKSVRLHVGDAVMSFNV
ncbi:uncharacterized protein VTP21DRAFT_5212 [Calcarisporiella thermophila]|uniref:uncharacterized protein n=1 Tax=Calcarisporiella thermophila TaxID=911321 RepID=UPI0037440506